MEEIISTPPGKYNYVFSSSQLMGSRKQRIVFFNVVILSLLKRTYQTANTVTKKNRKKSFITKAKDMIPQTALPLPLLDLRH